MIHKMEILTILATTHTQHLNEMLQDVEIDYDLSVELSKLIKTIKKRIAEHG